LSALHERRIAVPEDCAVVGCDDIPIDAHATPPLTTVHIPFFETGETAVRLLLGRISGKRSDHGPSCCRSGSCGAGEVMTRNYSPIGEE
jgi:DNA-binding LacI/PurR family transcriptional regulator